MLISGCCEPPWTTLIFSNHHQEMVSSILYFHPEPWGDDPIWRSYFSDGLKLKPPTRLRLHHLLGKNFIHYTMVYRISPFCSNHPPFLPLPKKRVIFKPARIMADLASEDSSRLLSSFESVLKGQLAPGVLGETAGPGRVDQVPLVRKSRGRNL